MKGLKKPAHCRLPEVAHNLPRCLFSCYPPSLYFANACSSRRTRRASRLNGDEEARTPDLRRAKAALSQLSYIPGHFVQPQGGPGWTRTNDLSLIRGTL